MSRHNSQNPVEQHNKTPQTLTFLQIASSILASFFGVQSAKNRERDFAHGKARAFILVGVLMTIVWYGSISLVVHFVLRP